jgi:hypothetical protein
MASQQPIRAEGRSVMTVRKGIRWRFWLESALALASASLLILTLVVPDWIELVTGLDPDAGNGAVELGISLGLAICALGSAAAASMDFRRRNRKVAAALGVDR